MKIITAWLEPPIDSTDIIPLNYPITRLLKGFFLIKVLKNILKGYVHFLEDCESQPVQIFVDKSKSTDWMKLGISLKDT